MTDLTGLAIVALAAAGAGAIVAALLARRRPEADSGMALLQQQLGELRGQMVSSLDGTTRTLAERTEALQSLLDGRIEAVTRTVNERLAENAEAMRRVSEGLGQRLDANLQVVGQRFTETSGMVTDVREKLKGLEEAAGRIFELSKDLASLQEILRPPKLRGGVGEVLLENLLGNGLPHGQYEMQWRFSTGNTVDAVIRLAGKLVPVDSKFPLDGFYAITRAQSDDERAKARREFLRQVAGHVKVIAEKYILPEEGTYDFALMYVPAESVYYEAVVRADDSAGVYGYALSQKVIVVSPTTFYAYLVALAYGLKGLQVEQQAEQIREGLAHLTLDIERIRDPMGRLGNQLRHAQGNFDLARRAMDRFGDRLANLSGQTLPESDGAAELPGGEPLTS